MIETCTYFLYEQNTDMFTTGIHNSVECLVIDSMQGRNCLNKLRSVTTNTEEMISPRNTLDISYNEGVNISH